MFRLTKKNSDVSMFNSLTFQGGKRETLHEQKDELPSSCWDYFSEMFTYINCNNKKINEVLLCTVLYCTCHTYSATAPLFWIHNLGLLWP
jgi:hypothetical protein